MIQARRAVLWVLIFGMVACLGAGAAELPGNLVYWSAERPLTWSDFQAAPPTGMEKTTFVAQPYLTLSFHFDCSGKGNGVTATAVVSNLEVVNSFDPSLSWAVLSRVDTAVLHHEQLHFDLQEVYRRLLELTLRPLTTTQPGRAAACVDALQATANAAGQSILNRATAAQERFETETEHGENLQKQAAWESQIAYLLQNPTAAP